MKSETICVGAIAGAFGVTGEVRLKSFTADPGAIVDYSPLTAADGRTFDIELGRPVKGGFAARLSGVASKEDADALRGTELFTDRANLPSLPDDEYYHADLMGLEVVDTGGVIIGRVKAVLNNGADDLLEVDLPGGGQSVLVPFTRAAVPTVDLSAGRIVVDPPEGILPD